MKKHTFVPLPEPVPRLHSLLHRLKQTPGPDDDESYLDQLMLFLDDPPEGVTNRWKEGAAMCEKWGISCSHGSVYRLFHSYAPHWRVELSLRIDALSEDMVMGLQKKTLNLVSLRVCEMLGNPACSPDILVKLARLEFAREKLRDGPRGDVERALAVLTARCNGNWECQSAIMMYRKHLQRAPSKPSPFPPGYLNLCTKFPTVFPFE